MGGCREGDECGNGSGVSEDDSTSGSEPKPIRQKSPATMSISKGARKCMIYRSLVSKINKLKFLQSPIKAHHLPPWWLYKHPVVWFARVPMISVSLTWEQAFFSSLVFPHPNGHSKRVHADIPGEATRGRVSRDQRLYGKIKVVNLLIGLDLFQREEHCVFLTVRSQFDIAFPKNEFITKTWLYFLTEIKRPGVATI